MNDVIAFRFNANKNIGYGHFTRCNEIANVLNKSAVRTVAIIDSKSDIIHPLDTSCFSQILIVNEEKDIEETIAYYLQYKVSAMLVDHYHCDYDYQIKLQLNKVNWGQYNFTCHGEFLGHFVININPMAEPEWYSQCNISPHTQLLLGGQYAVIKRGNQTASSKIEKNIFFNKKLNKKKAFVCFGAGNDQGLLAQCVLLLAELKVYKQINVVCTRHSESIDIIKKFDDKSIMLHIDAHNTEFLMKNCDFALCTAGTLTFELANVGLPFSCGYFAENQKKLANSWSTLMGTEGLGELKKLTKETLTKSLIFDTEILYKLKQILQLQVDGKAPERIARALQQL